MAKPWEEYASETQKPKRLEREAQRPKPQKTKPWEKHAEAEPLPAIEPQRPIIKPPGLGAIDYIGGAAGDLSLQGIAGLPAMVTGGIAGLGHAAANKLGFTDNDQYGDTVQNVMGAMMPEPVSQGGKDAMSLAQIPLQAWMDFADEQGGQATDQYASPARGTAVRTTIEGAPMILGGLVGMKPKPKAAARPQIEPTLGGRDPDTDPSVMRQRRSTPQIEAMNRARTMSEKAGIDWSALPRNVRAQIIEVSKTATDFEPADAAALKRIAMGGALPVPVRMTKGQSARDPVQLRAEENLAQTDAGGQILELQTIQNKALLDNLDSFESATGAKAKGAIQRGASVAKPRDKTSEGALAMASRKSSENVSALYKKADDSIEGLSQVDPTTVIEWLDENSISKGVAPSITAVELDLVRKGIISVNKKDGTYTLRRAPTMREMEKVRQLAVKLGKGPDTSGHMMSELKKVIDAATEEAGGDLYSAARQSRRRHAVEYENPRLIARLLRDDEKGRTVALEKVWKETVLGGSVAELSMLKNTLTKHPDAEVTAAGTEAWKNLSAETVEYLRKRATPSKVPDRGGQPFFSGPGFEKALREIGDEKLSMLFGEDTVRQLKNLSQVAMDTKTLPPYKGGSTTVPNLLSTLDKLLGAIPVAGTMARGAIRTAAKVYTEGKHPVAVREALAGPDFRATAKTARVKKRTEAPPPRISPYIPLSEIGLPAAEQEKRLAPFYAQGVSIGRDRTDTPRRER